jgi:hypothetical protein
MCHDLSRSVVEKFWILMYGIDKRKSAAALCKVKYYTEDGVVMNNKWRVFGLTVSTWIAVSVLSKLYAGAVPRLDIVSASSTVWAWCSLVMGFIMFSKTNKKTEILYGMGAFIISLFPLIGIVAGIAYFGRCYYQMEKQKQIVQ